MVILGNHVKVNSRKYGVVDGICYMRMMGCYCLSFFNAADKICHVAFKEKDIIMLCVLTKAPQLSLSFKD